MCSSLTDLAAINSGYSQFSNGLHPNNQLKHFSGTSAVFLKTRKAQFETSKTLKHFLSQILNLSAFSLSVTATLVCSSRETFCCMSAFLISFTYLCHTKQRVDWIIKALYMLDN